MASTAISASAPKARAISSTATCAARSLCRTTTTIELTIGHARNDGCARGWTRRRSDGSLRAGWRTGARMHLQIFDLDGSLSPQTSLGDAAPWQSIRTIDLRDLGPRLRLWSRGKTIAQTRQRLADLDAKIESTITLLGSGDFHHVAALLHERIREPFTLVHFDNHPDWVRFAPRWHCGSWMNQALALPLLARAITLGPCSDDLVNPGLKGGNLAA